MRLGLKKGDWVVVTTADGRELRARVLAASDAVIIVREATGFSTHIRYDAGLDAWTVAKRPVQVRREA